MTDNSAARGEIMQNNWESKRDWILFRERIAGWQEAYIGRLNRDVSYLIDKAGPFGFYFDQRLVGSLQKRKRTQ